MPFVFTAQQRDGCDRDINLLSQGIAAPVGQGDGHDLLRSLDPSGKQCLEQVGKGVASGGLIVDQHNGVCLGGPLPQLLIHRQIDQVIRGMAVVLFELAQQLTIDRVASRGD
ncbi:hypothetical protein D3C72_413430 [compost metagenome]